MKAFDAESHMKRKKKNKNYYNIP